MFSCWVFGKPPKLEARIMKQLGYNHLSKKNPFSLVFVKFAVCFIFLGIAYRLFSSSFVQFAAPPFVVTETTTSFDDDIDVGPHALPPPEVVVVVGSEPPLPLATRAVPVDVENRTSQKTGKCDIFVGDWVRDPGGPYYTNRTCFSIEAHQNCMKNGRPDTDYMYWRWKPRECDLPRFNARKFLDFMRNKSLAFIGDSIMRNHGQSLLCSLSEVEEAVEVYHDKQYKSRRWTFPDHHFTLSVVWSPFLSKATIFEDDNGVTSGITQLHLDELDAVWTQQLKNFDYIFTAGGKWFLKTAIFYENGTVVGCHNCHGKNITEIGFEYAYRKVINSTLKFITSSNHKVYAFLRTTTPDHFENGEWDSGGYCNRTKPFKAREVNMGSVDEVMRRVELEEFEAAAAAASAGAKGSQKGIMTLRLFDTTKLSLLRPDGHPGAYRHFHPFAGIEKNAKVQNDCLHWCLPGPIDSWNDLMLKMLLT